MGSGKNEFPGSSGRWNLAELFRLRLSLSPPPLLDPDPVTQDAPLDHDLHCPPSHPQGHRVDHRSPLRAQGTPFSPARSRVRSAYLSHSNLVPVAQELAFGNAGRQQLLAGVDILAKAVSVTLGPKGRNVIIEQPFGGPKVSLERARDLHSMLNENSVATDHQGRCHRCEIDRVEGQIRELGSSVSPTRPRESCSFADAHLP